VAGRLEVQVVVALTVPDRTSVMVLREAESPDGMPVSDSVPVKDRDSVSKSVAEELGETVPVSDSLTVIRSETVHERLVVGVLEKVRGVTVGLQSAVSDEVQVKVAVRVILVVRDGTACSVSVRVWLEMVGVAVHEGARVAVGRMRRVVNSTKVAWRNSPTTVAVKLR